MFRRFQKGRASHQFIVNFSPRTAARCASAATISAFLQMPAFLSSCTRETPLMPQRKLSHQLCLESTKGLPPESAHLFFFDTTGACYLDAYQYLPDLSLSEPVYGLSSAGVKRLVVLSDGEGPKADWYELLTYADLRKHSFLLAQESPERPLLVGECIVEDEASRRVFLSLHSMLTAIRIRSVSCDFSGRTYAGDTFHNKRLFISYAGTECHPLRAGDGGLASWLNAGALDSAGVAALPRPEMLLQEGCGEIGPERQYPGRTFYCYPHPDTRVVLEGTVGERLCYYPIPLPGMEPGCCYELDITILRLGSPSPDYPVGSDVVSLSLVPAPWEDFPSQTVVF